MSVLDFNVKNQGTWGRKQVFPWFPIGWTMNIQMQSWDTEVRVLFNMLTSEEQTLDLI